MNKINLNAVEFENYLKNELIGQGVSWRAGNLETKAYQYIQAELKKQGVSDEDRRKFNVTNQHKSFNMKIAYNGNWIGEICVKREKGKYHSSYWGNGYYDWTYKDIHVELDDLSTRLDEIDNYEQSLIDAKNNELLKAREAFKKLQDTFNINADEAKDLVYSIYNHRYELEAD